MLAQNPVINRVSPNKTGSTERGAAGPQEIPSRVQSPGKAGSTERTAATAILYRDSRGLPALKPLNGDNVMEDDILMLFQYYKVSQTVTSLILNRSDRCS